MQVRFAISAVVSALLISPVALLPAPAQATTTCGAVLVSGSAWLGGHGVDAHSNGADQGTAESCGNHGEWSTSNRSYLDGYAWQCVELAARLYYVKGWGRVHGAEGTAASIPEGSSDLTFHKNGSGYVPVPGDLVIESTGGYGHVAVVDKVQSNRVYVVEQNRSSTGRFAYTLSGSKLSASGATIRGVEHSPKNHSTNFRTADRMRHSAFITDFDGDHKSDVFATTGGKWLVSYSGTSRWKQINTSTMDPSRMFIGDLNGDHKSDIFATTGGKWLVSYSGTSRWKQINTSTMSPTRMFVG